MCDDAPTYIPVASGSSRVSMICQSFLMKNAAKSHGTMRQSASQMLKQIGQGHTRTRSKFHCFHSIESSPFPIESRVARRATDVIIHPRRIREFIRSSRVSLPKIPLWQPHASHVLPSAINRWIQPIVPTESHIFAQNSRVRIRPPTV
ncbi:hypothetical protein HN011_003024 [Eciton burchellii]|nr:hypothetical protein HN011_003024 [Eciton burchellii]